MTKELGYKNPFNIIIEEVEVCNGLKSFKIIKNSELEEEKDLWLLMQRSYIDGYMEVRGKMEDKNYL